jgi:hypothetical protein
MLPAMIIFKGKRPLKLNSPRGCVVAVQEKAWVDEAMMLRWVKEIYTPFTKKNHSLLIMDSFRAHTTDPVKKLLRKSNAVTAIIPGGCTSKLQPLDVAINKPFKTYMRKSWSIYISQEANKVRAGETTKIPAPTKQHIVDWVADASSHMQADIIKRSFKVCGISQHLNGHEDVMVHNDEYLSGLPDELFDDHDTVEFDGFTEQDVTAAQERLDALMDAE